MKQIFSVALILITAGFILAFSRNNTNDEKEGIQFFKGTWSEALLAAKKQNKPIFLDIYASWCGPCKMLKRNTFADKNVATFYNKNFINLSLDGEEGEGMELATKYQIKGYPSLLFFSSQGSVILHTAGYIEASEFNDLGEKIISSQKK